MCTMFVPPTPTGTQTHLPYTYMLAPPLFAHNSHDAALEVGERLPTVPVGEHCAGLMGVGGEAVRKRDSKRFLIVVAV